MRVLILSDDEVEDALSGCGQSLGSIRTSLSKPQTPAQAKRDEIVAAFAEEIDKRLARKHEILRPHLPDDYDVQELARGVIEDMVRRIGQPTDPLREALGLGGECETPDDLPEKPLM